jgi:hypothetical protein
MQFFNTVFVILSSLIIFSSFFVRGRNRIILQNILATLNMLIFCSTYFLLNYLHGFKLLAEFMGIDVLKVLFHNIGWEHIRIISLIILPFLFLFKRLITNKLLVVIIIFLLLSDIIFKFITSTTASFSFTLVSFSFDKFLLNSIHYFSWFVVVYALLFFAKRLPSQSKTIQS